MQPSNCWRSHWLYESGSIPSISGGELQTDTDNEKTLEVERKPEKGYYWQRTHCFRQGCFPKGNKRGLSPKFLTLTRRIPVVAGSRFHFGGLQDGVKVGTKSWCPDLGPSPTRCQFGPVIFFLTMLTQFLDLGQKGTSGRMRKLRGWFCFQVHRPWSVSVCSERLESPGRPRCVCQTTGLTCCFWLPCSLRQTRVPKMSFSWSFTHLLVCFAAFW